MACHLYNPVGCAGLIVAVSDPQNAIMAGVVQSLDIQGAISGLMKILASWLLVPSKTFCNTDNQGVLPWFWVPDWVAKCNEAAGPAQALRSLMLPLSVLLLVGGLVWQGIMMAVTRKGEPLLQAVRGVWNVGLWGAIGIAGTHMALVAGDSYTIWILRQTVLSNAPDGSAAALTSEFIRQTSPIGASLGPFLLLIGGTIMVVACILQIVLMIFREGGITILAGLLQLSAAGTVTRGTSSWQPRTLGWALALICWKPAAASVYAVSFLMMQGGARDWLAGVATAALSVVALPVLLKFFSTFTGQTGGGGGGMLGGLTSAAASAVHAGASLKGAVGGNNAGQHARYMDTAPSGNAGPTGAAQQSAGLASASAAAGPPGMAVAAGAQAGAKVAETARGVVSGTGAAMTGGDSAGATGRGDRR